MKHNLLKSVIISVILLMGVSNAWGAVVLRYQQNMPGENYDGNTSKTMTQSSANSDRYYCEISLTANSSYGFFIINGSNYYKVNVTATSNNSVQLYDYGSSNHGNSNHRVTYKSGTAGIYIFTYDASNHKICVSPKSSETIKIAYDVAQGHDDDWNLNNYVNLTQVGSTANYTIDLDLQAKKYYMFVQISNSIYWRAGSTLNVDGSASLYYYGTTNYGNSGDKINFTPSTAGKYRFTWNHQDKTIKLEPFYSVIYNGNSHTSGSVPTTSLHLKGSTVTVASNSGNLARTGYTFGGWNTNSAGTGTNYTAGSGSFTMGSSNTTLYAKWNENKYNVDISTDGNGTTNQTGTKSIGIVGISITATPKIGSAFKQWEVTGGAKVANATNASTTLTATAAGKVKAIFEEKPATTVYLKTTANWKDANARFAIYYWGANSQNGWVDMNEVGCDRDYFKGEIPYGSTGFNFVRMNPSALANNWDNKWDQTGDLSIPTNNNNCFTITNDNWDNVEKDKAEGTWGAFNPTVTLTLKSSSNGTYKITYKGKTYESSLTEDVVIPNLPLDAEIIISESATPNTGYMLKKCFIKLGTNAKEEATTNTPYTLCGNTTITADFVTKGPHTVYFKPNSNWKTNSARFAVYAYDEAGNEQWYDMIQSGAYYTCNIKSGLSNIIFVRMNPAHATNKFADGYSWNQTLSHAIPVNRFNTYILYDEKLGTESDEGYWTSAPTLSGAYRLRYVEQLVEHDATETWKVEVNETKACHAPDDVIQKRANGRDTISLFINIEGENPEVILQQYNGSKWVDIEAHMVNGLLEADAGKAMLPGRHNASPESDIDDFVYDNGIDAITESGVWNFVIVQDAEGNASLLLKENDQDVTHKYTGNYYIRTNNATGGWNEYTHPDNIMSRSTYSESGYSHYYCKWVDIQNSNIATPENVKFIVATDYSINVSREFAKDDYTAADGVLVENANVRWSWDENTGVVARAYIQGAYDGQNQNANIVLDYTTDGATDATDDVILFDTGDWIYSIDVNNVKVGSTLKSITATYPKTEHTIDDNVVNPTTQIFEQELPMLTGGDSENTYTVRVLYDFKIDKTFVALVPNNHEAKIGIDVMIERVNQEKTTAVQSTITATNDQFTVCGVMSFTEEHLTDDKLHKDLRQFYWISFPFNVNLEDVYGFGVYGKHWILETYNGERRAKDGLWLDSPSFWEYILDPKGVILYANKGYLLCLDSELLSGTSDVFTNTDKISLYFPAKDKTSSINTNYTTEVTIHEHICTIERAGRNIYDSNWNLIGVPSYANHTQTTNPENLQYFYDYQCDNQGKMIYAAKSTTNPANEFRSMYAYFVQWGGTLNWSTFTGENNTPKELAAKQNAAYEAQEHNLRLELQQDYKALDQTFVDMQEDGVTAAFDLNKDMTKILNAGANIYTLAGEENIQLAGNSLPIANTTIPVGVQIAKAGEYTFAMPDGTDGITVELIDYETNTRTNLLLSEYTVNLTAGTCENRFALSVKPNNTATSLDNISGETGNEASMKKFIIDGVLYMQKDGVLYDAQGHVVR